jgi:hypothetical protein
MTMKCGKSAVMSGLCVAVVVRRGLSQRRKSEPDVHKRAVWRQKVILIPKYRVG